jgi:hypothetical protein
VQLRNVRDLWKRRKDEWNTHESVCLVINQPKDVQVYMPLFSCRVLCVSGMSYGLGNLKAGKVMGNNLSSGPVEPRQRRGRY